MWVGVYMGICGVGWGGVGIEGLGNGMGGGDLLICRQCR